MANIVECSNLTKRYVKGYAPALDHANLTIPEGSGIVCAGSCKPDHSRGERYRWLARSERER